eukprot:SM000110S18881  [mRNA]  locus=s110:56750:62622:- [translate_table: standard]
MAGPLPPPLHVFDQYFRLADADGDGRISGAEAVGFFEGAGLPQVTLAKIWQFSDQAQRGFLNRPEFHNALKLVTVAQSGRELTADVARAALTGPAAAQIPPPRISSAPPAPSSGSAYGSRQYPGAGVPASAASLAGGQQGSYGQPQSQFSSFPSPAVQQAPAAFDAPSASSGFGSSGVFKAAPPSPSPPQQEQQPAMFSADFSGSGFRAQPPAVPATSNTGSYGSSMQGTSQPLSLASPTASFAGEAFAANAASGRPLALPQPPSSMSPAPLPTQPVSSSSGQGFGAAPPSMPAVNGPGHQQDAGYLSRPQANVQPVLLPPTRAQPPQQQSFSPGAQPPTAATPGAAWPQMTVVEAQRYTRVFADVDTDRDGKISGEQARELFLSWGLPRGVLKQVWELADEDADSMLSLREFCTALYLMERFREGRPIPSVLPLGIHFDQPAQDPRAAIAAARIAQAQQALMQNAAGYNVPSWQNTPGMLGGPALLAPPVPGPPEPAAFQTAPIGQLPQQVPNVGPQEVGPQVFKAQAPELDDRLVNQLQPDEADALKKKQREAADAEKNAYELEKELMDSKQKIEFYRDKMQEIILFKTRCDNRLHEVTERAALEKREVEQLSKRYNDRYKAAEGVMTRLQLEEKAFKDVQDKRLELYNALARMEQGGNPNGLLQERADKIVNDLEDLRRMVNQRAKQLGLTVRPIASSETIPFGKLLTNESSEIDPKCWQAGMQENALDWDEDWDKFVDEGFTNVQNLLDEGTNIPNGAIPTQSPRYSSTGGPLPIEDFSSPPLFENAEQDEEDAETGPADAQKPARLSESAGSQYLTEQENTNGQAHSSSLDHGTQSYDSPSGDGDGGPFWTSTLSSQHYDDVDSGTRASGAALQATHDYDGNFGKLGAVATTTQEPGFGDEAGNASFRSVDTNTEISFRRDDFSLEHRDSPRAEDVESPAAAGGFGSFTNFGRAPAASGRVLTGNKGLDAWSSFE